MALPGASSPSPLAGHRRLKLLVTILVASFSNSAMATGRLVLPLVALSMGASAWLVGVIAACFTAVPMLFSIPFGRWVDRTGTLVPFAMASLLIIAGGLIFLLLPSIHTLLAVAGLIGSGAVFAHLAATRAVSLGVTDKLVHGRYLGYLTLSYALFQFAGPIVGGFVYEHFGAVFSVAAIAVLGVLPLLVSALPVHNFESNASPVTVARTSGGAGGLLTTPGLRKWILVSSVFSAALTLYPFVVALHAVEVGLAASRAGILLGAFALGTLVSRACTGVVTRYLNAPAVAVGSLFLGAVLYAVLPLLDQIYPLVAVSFLLGMPLGLGVPISLALIYDAAPEGRKNESMGVCMTVTNFLQTVSPLSLGLVASGAGAGVAPMVWGLALLMVGCSAAINPQRRKAPDSPKENDPFKDVN